MPLVTSPWLQFDKLGHSALEPPEDTFTSIVVLKRIMSSFRIVPLLWHDGSFHYRIRCGESLGLQPRIAWKHLFHGSIALVHSALETSLKLSE